MRTSQLCFRFKPVQADADSRRGNILGTRRQAVCLARGCKSRACARGTARPGRRWEGVSILEDVRTYGQKIYTAAHESNVPCFEIPDPEIQMQEPAGKLPKGSLRVSIWFGLHVGSGTIIDFCDSRPLRWRWHPYRHGGHSVVVVHTSIRSPAFIMQRASRVFHVASALCPMRVRSKSVLKRLNARQTRVVQAEKNEAR